MRVLIVGCGYVGLPLGQELVRQGHEVVGIRRSASHLNELVAAGVIPVAADITDPDGLRQLKGAFDWVINCVASQGGGAEDYRRVYLQGARNLLSWLESEPPGKFVYTSSTSVYGQIDGSSVTEVSETKPLSETAQVLIESEQLLVAAVQRIHFPAIILRLAGIYGPGRGHWFKQYLNNEARLESHGQLLLNMIHRDDVTGAIIAALTRGQAGQIYNVADDEPVMQRDFFEWLSRSLGRAMPRESTEDHGSRKRGTSNKRVVNAKLKLESGWRLKFPTFREGYTAEIQRLLPTKEWKRAPARVDFL